MVATIGCVLMATGFSWCLLNFWHFLKYHLSIKSTGIILIIGIATAYLVYLASETLGSDGERNVLLLIATLLLSLNTVRLNYLIKPEQKEGRDASGQATDDSTAALTTVLTAEEARHTGRAVARIQKYLDSKGVAIFIANISMIPLKGMGALGFWGYRQFDTMETPQGYILMFLGSITLFVMASVPVFYYSTSRLQKANRSGMQMPFLLLIIGTFVAIITQVLGLSTAVSYTVSMVVGLYSQVLFCFATALYIKSTQYSAFRVCGIVYGTSFLIATVWIFLLEDMSQIVKFVILLIAYSTMIYLLKHEPDVIEIVKVVPSPGISADKPHISKNIERLTETFRLTKRESEILRLLAQGRSVPYIEEELTLSNGTVRTHVRHIYEKMNIHNKQELIDMVNSDGYIPFRQF
jgi:DNA-binding CsgD family transcriptional regulator